VAAPGEEFSIGGSMTDYYPLIARIVADLDRDTVEARHALYDCKIAGNTDPLWGDIASKC
jgi:hypothetical protein